jgi:glycosyltransferase involved in cell wall biosynthesis
VRSQREPFGTATMMEQAAIPASTGRPGVTIVVPCFNEEPALAHLRNRLQSVCGKLGRQYDIRLFLVDDGSTDNTWHMLEELFGDQPHCKLLRQPGNLGVSAAILAGIRNAVTEIVCSIDCDCTYDPQELAKLLPLLTPGVDLVTGSPYHPNGKVQAVPRWRLALSKTASSLYRRVLRQKLYTYTSCFRVYRRSAILALDLKEGGFIGVAELIGKLDLQGSTIVECPTSLVARAQGASKMKVARVMVGHLRLLVELVAQRAKRFLEGETSHPAPAKSQESRGATTDWAQY